MITRILQFMYARGAGEAALRRMLSFVMRNQSFNLEKLFTIDGITENLSLKTDVAQNILDVFQQAKSISNRLEEENITTLWIGHELYPSMLLCVLGDSAPPVVFCRGNIELLKLHGVGFCGSRKASDKGLSITSKCAEQLIKENICVVSGYAHGVDMSAHKAALKAGGSTIFVLVEGILRFQRKKEVTDLLSDENYLAISQFPPLLSWAARNAMRRNATIIGLSEAMILVESGLSGGTFAAGEETLKRHQPLFVIDFAAPGPSAEANPYFIEKGGIAIRGKGGKPNLAKVFDIVNFPKENQKKLIEETATSKNISRNQQGNLLE